MYLHYRYSKPKIGTTLFKFRLFNSRVQKKIQTMEWIIIKLWQFICYVNPLVENKYGTATANKFELIRSLVLKYVIF